MNALPKHWCDYLVQQPETGMGYTVATVITKAGLSFPQVLIDSGYATRVNGYDDIPFGVDDIADIIVTHEKWDWSAERPAR